MNTFEIEINGKPINPKYVRLSESYSKNPQLEVENIVEDYEFDILEHTKAEIKWIINQVIVFFGYVHRIRYDQATSLLYLKAFSKSKDYDLTKQTIFYGLGEIQKSNKDLLAPLFKELNVFRTDLLESKSYFILQNDESKLNFLIRIVGKEDKALHISAASGNISISDGTPNKQVEIPKENIISYTIESCIENPHSELRSWDTGSGKKNEPTTGKIYDQNSKIISAIYNKIKVSSETGHQLFSECIENRQFTVNRNTASSLSAIIKINIKTSDHKISVGDGIKISQHSLKDELMIVCSRVLSFDPANHNNQLVNEIECRIVTGKIIPTDFIKRQQKYTHLLLGQVVDVNDPVRIGRVKIHFPFHTEQGNTLSGIWCKTLNSFDGQFTIPKPFEFVYVLINSESSLPIVLGSIYKKNTLPPQVVENIEKDIILLSTPSGVRMYLKDSDQNSKFTLVIEKDGSTYAELSIENGEIILSAKDGLTINADTKIIGKVDIDQ